MGGNFHISSIGGVQSLFTYGIYILWGVTALLAVRMLVLQQKKSTMLSKVKAYVALVDDVEE